MPMHVDTLCIGSVVGGSAACSCYLELVTFSHSWLLVTSYTLAVRYPHKPANTTKSSQAQFRQFSTSSFSRSIKKLELSLKMIRSRDWSTWALWQWNQLNRASTRSGVNTNKSSAAKTSQWAAWIRTRVQLPRLYNELYGYEQEFSCQHLAMSCVNTSTSSTNKICHAEATHRSSESDPPPRCLCSRSCRRIIWKHGHFPDSWSSIIHSLRNVSAYGDVAVSGWPAFPRQNRRICHGIFPSNLSKRCL